MFVSDLWQVSGFLPGTLVSSTNISESPPSKQVRNISILFPHIKNVLWYHIT
jgi:hypothetical protein